jgi:hypothetical protein
MLEERERERSAKGITLRLQRYHAPLLDAKIAALSGLGGALLTHLLGVRQQLGLFNAEVDRCYNISR